MRFVPRLLCLLALITLPLHAQNPQPPPITAPPITVPPITVFAAASLKESLDEVSAAWTRQSGQRVSISYAGSSALAKQIEQGAPADVFVSADNEWMDYLQQRKLIDSATRFDLAGNRLVVIAPADGPGDSALRTLALKPAALRRALGDGRLAVAETASVPAGRYAKQALTALGLWDTVSGDLAQADNVRAAMAFVARGEAPLGIVYATDAQAEPKVRVVARFPARSHDVIVYPVARVAATPPSTTQGFLAFLRGARAQAVFKRAGFPAAALTLDVFTAEETTAIALSLRVAAMAVLCAAPFAVATAYVLARWNFRGKVLFDALVHLPLLMPPVLTGYALLVLLGRQGPVGRWLLDWFGFAFAFRWTGAVVAAAIMAFPLFVRSVRLSIEAVPREIDEMAASLGARPWATFWQVILPLSFPGLAAGATLAFAKALGEFGATITFVSNIPGETQTISLAMHTLTQTPNGGDGIARLAVVSLALALGALIASEWAVRRSAYRRQSE